MLLRRARWCLLSAFCALSCAPTPPRSAAAVTAAPAPLTPFAVTVEWEPRELSTPEGVVVRFKSPQQTLPRIVNAAMDPALRDFSDAREWSTLAFGEEISNLIDLDAPVDVLFARSASAIIGAAHLSDEAHFAPEKLASKLKAVSGGRWQIEGTASAELRCELWHVAPPVGFRVVCGQSADAITRFAPFLLGRLAEQPFTADLRLESAHTPLAARPGLESKAQQPEASDGLSWPWFSALVNAEALALDVKWLAQDVELGAELEYPAEGSSDAFQSWITGTRQPLPEQFWQVLDLSPLTVASAGVDESTLQRVCAGGVEQQFVRSLIEATTSRTSQLFAPVCDASGEQVPERLRFTVSREEPASSTVPAEAPRAPTPSRIQSAHAGWQLLGFAGSGERFKAALDQLLANGAEKTGKGKRSDVASSPSRYVRLARRSPELPEQSVAFRVSDSGGPPVFGWLWPTPSWVWLLTAGSESQLIARAERFTKASSEPAPDTNEKTLLGNELPLLAMSFNLAALRKTFGDALADVDAGELPFGGSARVFLRVTGERRQRAEQSFLVLQLKSRWSPAALADLVAAIKAHHHPRVETEAAAPSPE